MLVEVGPVDDDVLPSPAKPSLMMRLFRSGDSQKSLLKTMFEEKENLPIDLT